jgi:hypothetical protein
MEEVGGYEVINTLTELEDVVFARLVVLSDSDFDVVDAVVSAGRVRSVRITDSPASSREQLVAIVDEQRKIREANRAAFRLCDTGEYLAAAKLLRPSTSTAGTSPWSAYGITSLAGGDIETYRSVCREMMARFRRRLFGDEESVRLSLLSSNSGVPMSEMRRLMPHIELMNPHGEFLCWYQATNALLEYRDGSFLKALKLLSSVQSDRFPAALASAEAIRAMAYFRLGEVKLSAVHLEFGRKLNAPLEPVKLSNERLEWSHHLYARLLLDEAEALIKGSSTSATPK